MGISWIGAWVPLLSFVLVVFVAGLALYIVVRGAVLSALRAHAAEREDRLSRPADATD